MRGFDGKMVRTTCQSCYMGCGVLIKVRNGKAVKIKGDPDHPVSRGHICPKGESFIEYVYHPQRLRYPLKKGKEGWERTSWEEALDITSRRLLEIKETYGPLAIAMCASPPWRNIFASLLLRALGSPNYIGSTEYCEGPGRIADYVTVGETLTNYPGDIRPVDFKYSKCILIWGCDVTATHRPYWHRMKEAQKNGSKLIVIDPRCTAAASQADLWLQPRPGSDGALALGMLNVVTNEGLYDKEFVDKWCTGFEELREHVQEYSPEQVEKVTWVASEKIREAARMFAKHTPAYLYNRLGSTMKSNATQTTRAQVILLAITGSIDTPGGNLLAKKVDGFIKNSELRFLEEFQLPNEVEKSQLGADRYPLYSGPGSAVGFGHSPSLKDAILYGNPYFIKALIQIDYNMILSIPDSRKTREALEKLDFMVSLQYFLTPTSELADIVLPCATWPETEEISDTEWGMIFRERAVDPPEDCWEKEKIIFELAKKLGKPCRWKNTEELMRYKLKGAGLTLEDLKTKRFVLTTPRHKVYEERNFGTPSGKVELYSNLLEKHGYAPLPNHQELPESEISTPELVKEYPLILVNRRHLFYTHTDGRQISSLRKRVPEPIVEMHPSAIKKYGVEDGEWAWIESTKGRRIKAKVASTKQIHPKVIAMAMGWWFPEKAGPEHGCFESNFNVLTSDIPCDPIIGVPDISGLACKVLPIRESRKSKGRLRGEGHGRNYRSFLS